MLSSDDFLRETLPEFGVVNGVNQLTTTVSGFDDRQKGTKKKNAYYLGQYFADEDGVVNYDYYNLYENNHTNWAAMQPKNQWADITFEDVRKADAAYDGLTLRQQNAVDSVRALAVQLGYWDMFCIDEPSWYCAYLSPEEAVTDDSGVEITEYKVAILDTDASSDTVNTYKAAQLFDTKI